MVLNLFGEQRIKPSGELIIDTIANHILDLLQHNPELLQGNKIGTLDRKITLALWYDDGLKRIIPEDKRAEFEAWFLDSKTCRNMGDIGRALRYLRDHDYIRYPEEAVIRGERDRSHISQNMKRT